ncbi:hypothetical protein [Aromatoleum evansii]|uniref:hypothetical protein n=1 Tax=Aromatoleum evansii TaxID=59406 RepID=UPI00145F5CBE|nr:hypothetical protein [Aromatoleum evansii]NMG30004.1 hypothetical protein [Aromatoleum evansii]
MKSILIAAMAASLGLAVPAYADDAHHPEQAAAAAQAPADAPAQTLQKMQDNVKKMEGQLDRVAKAKTDEDRQKAIAEHMLTMQENMTLARGMQGGMMGCPMMGSGMGAMMGAMMGQQGGPGDGSMQMGMMARMQQMEKRLDMMQMMMEQSMRGQAGRTAVPAR